MEARRREIGRGTEWWVLHRWRLSRKDWTTVCPGWSGDPALGTGWTRRPPRPLPSRGFCDSTTSTPHLRCRPGPLLPPGPGKGPPRPPPLSFSLSPLQAGPSACQRTQALSCWQAARLLLRLRQATVGLESEERRWFWARSQQPAGTHVHALPVGPSAALFYNHFGTDCRVHAYG